jgi:hypothetical protein
MEIGTKMTVIRLVTVRVRQSDTDQVELALSHNLNHEFHQGPVQVVDVPEG